MENIATEVTGKGLTKENKIIFLFWGRTETAFQISLKFNYQAEQLHISHLLTKFSFTTDC
jgi:hypothetical protein